ncbi:MAG TPA: CoA transferase [Dehalococcoidia bacterium]|nr:CoA transferase [Dehalococcoidia bacterium]
MTEDNTEGLLSPYRALDLTNEHGFLCGKILGDLGTDVIKIEKPGGDPARRIGPFYNDIPDPEKSLYWMGFNTNKRGITLDIETVDGQAIFKRLVKSADFVFESFDPGYMEQLGLGYSNLSQINPAIIMASISSFGQTGPYKDYKATDLVLWALSGIGYLTGDADRAPIMTSFPISYFFGAMSAAVGALVALGHRAITGEGQYVDAPAQLGLGWSSGPEAQGLWGIDNNIVKRSGRIYQRAKTGVGNEVTYIKHPIAYECKDGAVKFFPFVQGGSLYSTTALTEWVIEENMASETLKYLDWGTLNWQTVSQETVDEITQSFSRFFLRHTKAELWEGAQKRGIMLYPVLTPKDILEFEQLNIRDYWEEVEHPELGTSITYPGAFAKMTEAPCRIRRRAPLIGEHNEEIYVREMGLSTEELLALKQAKVV